MEVGGHDQHTVRAQHVQASVRVVGLGKSGKTGDWTYRNAACFRKSVNVALCNVDQALIVDDIPHLNIDDCALRHSLPQEFESAGRAGVGFACEYQDGVRRFRFIHHQKARGLAGQRNQDGDQKERDEETRESHLIRMLQGKRSGSDFDYNSNQDRNESRKNRMRIG